MTPITKMMHLEDGNYFAYVESTKTADKEDPLKDTFNINVTNVPTVDFLVEKIWKDNNNQDGIRPESIKVYLYANGEPAYDEDGNPMDAELQSDSNGKWTYTFDNLPAYSKDGEKIIYTVIEDAVDDYSTTYGENGVIVNTYTPEQTSVSVAKAWNDGKDADGIRPDRVTIHLYADGKDTGKTLTLSEDNDWVSSFTGVAKYQEGKEIKYTVKEEAIEGYKASISGSMEKGYAIVNTHEVTSTGKDDFDSSNPKTGDSMNGSLYLTVFVLIGISLAGTVIYRRKHRG